jgi:predicted PurR-regulated permease PerM
MRSMIHLLVLSFGLFYFFLDGDRFLAFLRDISPFEPHVTRAFFHEFEAVAWAMVFGSGLSAALGAALACAGYAILQVPSPVFWGVLTGIFTLAPGIGSALIFIPLAGGLAVLGHAEQGAGVVLYCFVFLVVINDSLVRPILVGQRLRLHPFIILLSIFGGVEAYGVSGLFVGPLAAALAVSVLRIYHRDAVDYTDLGSETPGHVKVGTGT